MNLPTLSLSKISASGDLTKSLAVAVPVLSILISIGIAFFIVWPKFNEVLALRKANKEMVVRAEVLENKAQSLQGLDRSLLTRQLELSEQLLPSQRNIFTLLATVENAATASGVLLDKVDVVSDSLNESTSAQAAASAASGAKSTKGTSVQIKLSLASSYSSLLQFLGSLLTTSRVIEIEDLNVSSAKGEGSALSATFTLRAFWNPLPSDLGAIENNLEKLTAAEAQLLDKVQSKIISLPQVELPVPPLGRPDLFAPF